MRYLWLSPELAQAILQHAHADHPHEACGVIVGQAGRASRVIPVANVADDPTRFYRLDERALSQILLQLNAHGDELLGFYHSHPVGDTLPSPTDIREAHYPDCAYLIVGMSNRADVRLSAWLIRALRVTALPVHIGRMPPPTRFGLEPDLSRAQKIAILTASFVALVALIVIAVTLLPPAPPLP